MPSAPTRNDIVERAGALALTFAGRADAAEQARRLPAKSARALLDLGLARILMPARFGGYELDFKTWHDAVLAISPRRRLARLVCQPDRPSRASGRAVSRRMPNRRSGPMARMSQSRLRLRRARRPCA